jgi:hypothetical protein
MTIEIGDIVTYRFTGSIAYVVRGRDPMGRWLIVAKQTDLAGRSAYTLRQAGEGDVTVVAVRPTFSPDAEIMHGGIACRVLHDDGDFVTLSVPRHTVPLRGDGNLVVPDGTVEVAKSDVVLSGL